MVIRNDGDYFVVNFKKNRVSTIEVGYIFNYIATATNYLTFSVTPMLQSAGLGVPLLTGPSTILFDAWFHLLLLRTIVVPFHQTHYKVP